MWRSIGLYGFSSINLGLLMLGGYYLGGLLEKHYHLKNASFSGVFIGLVLGLYELFTIAFKAGTKK
jgi:hypothetical protein